MKCKRDCTLCSPGKSLKFYNRNILLIVINFSEINFHIGFRLFPHTLSHDVLALFSKRRLLLRQGLLYLLFGFGPEKLFYVHFFTNGVQFFVRFES